MQLGPFIEDNIFHFLIYLPEIYEKTHLPPNEQLQIMEVIHFLKNQSQNEEIFSMRFLVTFKQL